MMSLKITTHPTSNETIKIYEDLLTHDLDNMRMVPNIFITCKIS